MTQRGDSFLNLSKQVQLSLQSSTLQDLMVKVYDGAYSSGELIIKVLDADLKGIKGSHDTFCVIDFNNMTDKKTDSKDNHNSKDNNNNNNNQSTSLSSTSSRSMRKLSSIVSKRNILGDMEKNGGSSSSSSGSSAPERRTKQFRTSVIPKESNPFWNEGFITEVASKIKTEVYVEVRSWSFIGREKVLGKAAVPLKALVDGALHETVFPLMGDKEIGFIRLQLTFTSALRRNMDYVTASDHFDALTELLRDKEGKFISVFCKVCRDDELSMALIRFFNSHGIAMQLLHNLLTTEVQDRGDATTLFRVDSMATKTMRNYFHLISRKSYLSKLVQPLIEDITAINAKGGSFEVFPNVEAVDATLEENTHNLWTVAEKFTKRILASYETIPGNMKKVFGILGHILRSKYGTLPLVPAGSLFFLRFISPAIVFPTEHGVVQGPLEPNIYRGLLLVGKLLQGIASRTAYREEALFPFQELVPHFDEALNTFLTALCKSDNAQMDSKALGPVDDPRVPYTKEEMVKLLSIIVRKIHIHLDVIVARLREEGPKYESVIEKLNICFRDISR